MDHSYVAENDAERARLKAVVAAAEAVDHKAETLPASIVEAILAVRPRSLARAIHRRQHLDQIERALAG